jgi:hypothetical protein
VSVRSVAPLKTAIRIPIDGRIWLHSIPRATGKIVAQPPPRRFTWQLVAFRYGRRPSIEHIRPAARGGSASTTMRRERRFNPDRARV